MMVGLKTVVVLKLTGSRELPRDERYFSSLAAYGRSPKFSSLNISHLISS